MMNLIRKILLPEVLWNTPALTSRLGARRWRRKRLTAMVRYEAVSPLLCIVSGLRSSLRSSITGSPQLLDARRYTHVHLAVLYCDDLRVSSSDDVGWSETRLPLVAIPVCAIDSSAKHTTPNCKSRDKRGAATISPTSLIANFRTPCALDDQRK